MPSLPSPSAAVVLILGLSFAYPFDVSRAGDDTLPRDNSREADYTGGEPLSTGCATSPFLPLPEWSRFQRMPPLPAQLSPLGRKPVMAAAPPLVKPAQNLVMTPTPKNKPVPHDDPALVAVSPFLQWVKDHPQEAAAAARKEADAYRPAAPTGPGAGVSAADPYWMPPLTDPSTSATDGTPGSSAAIYSTPQR